MKLNGSGKEKIYQKEKIHSDWIHDFYVKDNTIYYIGNNDELYRMEMNGENVQKITDRDMAYSWYFNMGEDGIYYITEDEDTDKYFICHINYNGKGKTKIVEIENSYTPINIIRDTVFYIEEDDEGNAHVYRSNRNGKNKAQLKNEKSIEMQLENEITAHDMTSYNK